MVMLFSEDATAIAFEAKRDKLAISVAKGNSTIQMSIQPSEAYYLKQLLKDYPDPMIFEDNLMAAGVLG